LVSRAEVMINRDSWGHSYLTVRGEILGFVKDGQTGSVPVGDIVAFRQHKTLMGCFKTT